jgi:NAD(P)-dependent dehydrogenase (short-subunit alcohol dehydrogenase family)
MAALITGGDSGIGRAVAVLFAREGADVAIAHLDEDEDASRTRALVEREGARCLVLKGDVKDAAFCDAAVREVLDTFGSLDVLVNNAAFQEHAEKIEDVTDEHLDETLLTNIGGYFRMARAAVPHMKAGGSIINTGSETALFGSKHLLDYSATKGAIHAFTKSAGEQPARARHPRERGGAGTVVDAVEPGRPQRRRGRRIRAKERHGPSGAAGGDLAGLRVPGVAVCASYVNGVVLPVMGGPRG